MSYLCAAIFVRSLEQATRDIASAAEHGADMVELRIDALIDRDEAARIIAASILPCIVTCRPVWEGGQSDLPDPLRLALLNASAGNEAAYIDLEFKAWQSLQNSPTAGEKLDPDSSPAQTALQRFRDTPRDLRNGLILSKHFFSGRPERLYNEIADLNSSPADVSKIVWSSRTIRDNLEVFDILRQRIKPTIALCMGESGLISRILAKKFGAFLTFASLETDSATAPGQITLRDMKTLYRWDAISPGTKVYGVVGSPIAHSMSPAIHNAAFDAIGFDGVYLPLLVNEGYESFKAFMETFLRAPGLDLCGLSITIPHKENALRYLREYGPNAAIEPLAETIGALNTIVIDRGEAHLDLPNLRGFSTDYAAILDSITTKLNISREDLRDYRVAVIGAGGTGRTAVAALAHYGATVVIYNRTRQRAEALAAEFNGRTGKVIAADFAALCKSCCQIYFNTTSIGMHPNVSDSPFGAAPPAMTPQSLIFDAVYNPLETRLLHQAREAGAKTIDGIEMFVRQAAAQFEAWTAKSAPNDLMRKIVEARLQILP